ncbi:MAG: carbon storage regulator [Planctomycetes bacterium]|nr:carbon storage regulator [Planctomycetota bacterium]
MLVISRRCGEKIRIGETEVVVLATGARVKLGVNAPANTQVHIVKHTSTQSGLDMNRRAVVH